MDKSEFLGLNLPSRDSTTDIADINAISNNFRTIDSAFLDLVEKEIPKLQTKENINLNFDDDSTNEEQYPSVPSVVNFTNRKVDPLKIINSASGSAIALKDSAKDKLVNLKLFGKTTQNGTPTPDNPIDLVSVGDSGSFKVGVYGRNILDVTKPSTTSNGVVFTINADKSITYKGTATATFNFPFSSSFGIPKGKYKMLGDWSLQLILPNNTSKYYTSQTFEVTEDGSKIYPYKSFTNGTVYDSTIYPMLVLESVTDETYEPCNKQTFTNNDTLRGVGDIADEKDFAKGVTTQRFGEISLSTLSWVLVQDGTNYYWQSSSLVGVIKPIPNTQTPLNALATNYTPTKWLWGQQTNCIACNKNGVIACHNESLTEKPSGVLVYEKITPTETALTETELNAYRQLYTNKGTTTILSEADMEVSYVADTKLYIDNKIAELTALTLEV